MKLFTKKTLAILLSALIVMGSISVAVFAAYEGTLTSTTKFDNSTAEKVYVKPGDSVKAVVTLTSNFNAGSMAFEYQYDSDMFKLDVDSLTAHASITGAYNLVPSDGSEMVGYYIDGASVAPGGNPSGYDTVFVSVQKFKVQEYNNSPAFEIPFLVKDNVPLDKEGEMNVMPGSVRDGDNDDYPTQADYVTNDAVIGSTQPLSSGDFVPAEDYDLTVNSTSNKVVVKGSVKYDPNGGTIDGSGDAVTVDGYYGKPITENEKKPADITPEAPTGKTFIGWAKEDNATEKLSDDELAAITNAKEGEETVLYAVYDLLPVTLTFDSQGGSNVDPIEEKPGTAITAPDDPTKEGYDFGGWYTDAACTDGNEYTVPSTMPDESKTVYAKWTPKKFHIYYDENGGAPEATDPEVEYDTNLPDDPTVARTGYTFDKWVYSETAGGAEIEKPAKMPAKDLYAKAQWTREVSITLDKDGDEDPVIKSNDNEANYTDSEGNPVTPDSTDPTKLPGVDPTEDTNPDHPNGGEFEGWKINAPGTPNDGKLYDFSKSPRENLGLTDGADVPDFTLTPSFVPYYNVTYKNEDGSEVRTDKVLEGSELPAQPADPDIPEGKVFKGWLDSNDKKPTDYAQMPANDLVFTATFADQEAGTYKAIFKDGDKTIEEEDVKEGDPIPLPSEPKKFGFVFKGWEPEVPDAMPGNDIEFQAQWEIDKTLIAVVVGGTLVAGGVATAIAATNTALIVGGAVVGGIAVAAIASKTHKVTYLVDGNTYRIFYFVEGSKIIVPKDPSKDGYTFKGWNPEVPERMPDHDLVFEAQFARTGADVIDDVPATGSAAAGLAVFAVISGACAAAYVMNKKKKEF